MTDIEWCDETLNPQGWGCWGPGGTPEAPKRCWYCYLKRLQKWPGSKCELCQQLIPHWHPERLELPYRWRKPRRIFWGSTGDLFHPYTPVWQIQKILEVVRATSQHTHIFCTKNPFRYNAYNPWPSNCILLTTITNQKDADERIPGLLTAQARVLGVSHEPLLGAIDLTKTFFQCVRKSRFIKWAIIGGMTGPDYLKHLPQRSWVQNLIDQYRGAGVPTFLKNNLKWPEKIQEWPCQMSK